MKECVFDQRFDDVKMLQYVNNDISVLHCHHYAGLFTKLALSMKSIGGPNLLFEAMEEASYLILKKYFITHAITAMDEKVAVAEEYFGLMGLGKLELRMTSSGGSGLMRHAHVDEGWMSKWGKSPESVNFIGQGYLAGAFSVIAGLPIGSCSVTENRSIVKGDSVSEFALARKGA